MSEILCEKLPINRKLSCWIGGKLLSIRRSILVSKHCIKVKNLQELTEIFIILGIKLPSQEIFMQNYLSIGVDALVTFNFHKARESPFYLMSSRLINKLIYFSYGTKDVLERECKDLNKVQTWHTTQKYFTIFYVILIQALFLCNICVVFRQLCHLENCILSTL